MFLNYWSWSLTGIKCTKVILKHIQTFVTFALYFYDYHSLSSLNIEIIIIIIIIISIIIIIVIIQNYRFLRTW